MMMYFRIQSRSSERLGERRRGSLILALLFLLFVCFLILATLFPGKVEKGSTYLNPTWLDNEHILCVKDVSYARSSSRFDLLGPLMDASSIGVREDVQIVAISLDGQKEVVLQDITFDRPQGGYKLRRKSFKGLVGLSEVTSNPRRRLIAFASNQGIFLMDFNGKQPRNIVTDKGRLLRFSPDGRYLQYTFNDKVWLYDLDNSQSRVLIENAVGGPWSPDGRSIIFARGPAYNREVFLYDLEHHQEKPLTALNEEGIYAVEDWSPDGSMLAAPSGVYSIEGKYLGIRKPYNARWSFDGQHLVGDSPEKGTIAVIKTGDAEFNVLR